MRDVKLDEVSLSATHKLKKRQIEAIDRAATLLGYPRSAIVRAAIDEFLRLLHIRFPSHFEMPPSLKEVPSQKLRQRVPMDSKPPKERPLLQPTDVKVIPGCDRG